MSIAALANAVESTTLVPGGQVEIPSVALRPATSDVTAGQELVQLAHVNRARHRSDEAKETKMRATQRPDLNAPARLPSWGFFAVALHSNRSVQVADMS